MAALVCLAVWGDLAAAQGDRAGGGGVGGWFNQVGRTDYDFVFLDTSELPISGFLGVRVDDLTYTEGHVNAFYRDVGLEFGLVHSKAATSDVTIDQFFFGDTVLSRPQLVSFIGAPEVRPSRREPEVPR